MVDGTIDAAQRGSLVGPGPGAGKAMIGRRLEALPRATDPAAIASQVVEDLRWEDVSKVEVGAAR